MLFCLPHFRKHLIGFLLTVGMFIVACGLGIRFGSNLPTLSYSGATGTIGILNQEMKVEPTSFNGPDIDTVCRIKPGSPNAEMFPATLTVDAATCVISGTPKAAFPPTEFTLIAENSEGASADATLTLAVYTSRSIVGATLGESTCALSSLGKVYCWGNNDSFQLGDGSQIMQKTPVSVVGIGGSGTITAISVGALFACALSSSGNVYCWGGNSSGQLGNGSSNGQAPMLVSGIGSSGAVTAISSGASHSCALSSSGTVFCWGSNAYGQLGDTTVLQRNTPVAVVGVGGSGYLSDIVNITAGSNQTCAVSSAGRAFCWGYNSDGNLGNGSTSSPQLTPTQVTGAALHFSNVSPGSASCAVSSSGFVWCWGPNSAGQLGVGVTSSPQPVPSQVHGVGGTGFLSGISGAAGGAYHVCAVSSSGNVYCWGSYANGQVGIGLLSGSTSVPVPVTLLTEPATAITAGPFHTCAMASSGNAYCWGLNDHGQIGDGTNNTRTTPTRVSGSF